MVTPINQRLNFAISAALGLTTFIYTPSWALDDRTIDEGELIIEEVIVTGTRIKTVDGFGRTSPVTVVGMDEISSFGFTRVEEVLNALPQMEPDQTSFINGDSSGTANLNLRGLGAKRTLTLINGHRMQPGGVYEESADINQIPAMMIERVEVLTGGASATYGADAVAGVVNFIMRRVNGVEFNASINGYQHNNNNKYIQGLMDEAGFDYPTGNTGIDGRGYNINIVIGGDFANGRGNATAYANWRKNDPLLRGDRDYSSCTLDGPGTVCGGSMASTEIPNFWIAPLTEDGWGPYGYDYFQEEFLILLPDSSLAVDDPYNPTYRYNFAPINYYMRPDERWSFGAFVDYEINEHADVYLETMGFNDYSNTQLAESGTFWAEAYPLPLSNAYFPENFRQSLEELWPGEDDFGIYIGKRNTEGGPRREMMQHSSLRIVAGVRGSITSDWDYDVSYLHAETSSSATYVNDILMPTIANAVDSRLCEPDRNCIPYEVFTYQGVTVEAADSLSGTAVLDARTATDIFQAYATGNTGWGLPAGDIMAVAGYEHREISFERVADELWENGLLSGNWAVPSITGDYTVDELFFEANIPLLQDRAFARNMTLDLAYRYSDYSTSGGNSTYRAGLDWQVMDWLRLRTGYNRAVRAPNIGELFSPQALGSIGGEDPCSGEEPLYSPEQCARTGVSAEQYGHIDASPYGSDGWINVLWGGNPDLDPETADTITVGMVFDINDAMRLSFDYWDIKIKGRIEDMDPGVAFNQCALYDRLCQLVQRAPNGSLWRNEQGYLKGIAWNLGGSHSRGVDMAWTWSPGEHWRTNLIGTWYIKKETTPIAEDPDTSWDCAGTVSAAYWGAEADCSGPPKWRHIASLSYDSNSFWTVTGRWRYYSKRDYVGNRDLIVGDYVDAHSYLDLSAVFRFMETHSVSIGVNNILDEEPPMTGSSIYVGGYYDNLGRFLFADLTLRW